VAMNERLAFLEITVGYVHDEVKELSGFVNAVVESGKVNAAFDEIIANQSWEGVEDVQ